MSQPRFLPAAARALALLLCLIALPALAADDKKEEKKEDDKKETTKTWVSIFSANGGAGFKHFDLPANAKVRFTWETTRDGQVPNFRVTVAKHNARIDNYQIIGTLVSTQQSGKGSNGMVLEAGKYRLYFATKFMKYTFTAEYEKKE